MRKILIGGNWKCNNTIEQTKHLLSSVIDNLEFDSHRVEVVIAPISLHLSHVALNKKNPNVQIAAQNCSNTSFGAFTGEIAAEHLKDVGIKWVILGHSQRRNIYGESDALVAQKVQHALKQGLIVIFCCGEHLQDREAGKTFAVIQRQLKALEGKIQNWENIVIAYEPVWAIGTGKTATPQEVTEVHDWIRNYIKKQKNSQLTRIIYGGSVTEKNSGQLIQIQNVDGFLVGGASLKPAFLQIVESAKLKK